MTSITSGFSAAIPAQGAIMRMARASFATLSFALLGGCAATGLSTAVGPSRGAILKAGTERKVAGMEIVPLTNVVAERLSKVTPQPGFAEVIGDAQPIGTIVGVGDALEVTIWEAPPAVLFNVGTFDTRIQSASQTSRPGTFPETVVGPSGAITIPFAGQVPAAGRSLRQIEQTIVARLRAKANQPQVIVRIARNATANVSVVGEVGTAGRFPLTPRGERLLDVIAQAGGTKQAVDRMTIQVTRGTTTATMPLQAVVRDARQNIVLERDDIVTALYQPNSFVVLGAAGRNEEVRFEGVGLTLSQALGRLGGLQDMRADPKGVFLFRWESAERMAGLVTSPLPATAGPIPVVFQINLKEPETFFAAQNFAMKNGDVIFISNSPASDLQRFVNLIASTVLPALSVTSTVRAQ
ncbi:MAG: polysaccharide export protein [Sphingomonas bacterium]|nr:polysaccharide export protein [Sphingomonas bacterium]